MTVSVSRTAIHHLVRLALIFLAGCGAGCAPAAPPCAGAACGEVPEPDAAKELAPDLDGGAAWLNTERPLSLADLRGHVVVLDFWTYCCINCLHVLPELERIERRFADRPFQVIGVHSGKFDAEKDASRIRTAMERHGVRHPVVVDSSFAIWRRFGAEAWPTLVIIGPEGEIVARVAGEPKAGALATVVSALLDKGEAEGKLASHKLAIDAPSTAATGPLAFPGKVAVAPTGDIAVADSSHHRVVLLSPDGQVKDIAGSGIAGSADGGFETAAFRYPQGMVFDAEGLFLYVADTENHQIRRLDLASRTVVTVAGTGAKGSARAAGPAREVALRSPWALARGGADLLVAMAGSHQIWKLSGDTIAPFAGSGVESIGDGPLADATFSQPSGLALVDGTLYVADSEVSAIRAVDLKAGTVSTLVGTGLFDFGDRDGQGREVRLQHALGVVSRGGVLFIADTFNDKLKRLDPATQTVKTVAGGEGELSEPGGLALLPDGRVLIADTNNHRLRTFDPASGALEPFDITGLAPPAARGLVLAESAGIGAEAPRLAVKASGRLGSGTSTIVIEPRAPAGAKLTDGSPVVAEVDVAASSGLTLPERKLRVRVSGGRAELRIPVVATGAAARAVIETSFFWCTTGDEQACYPAHAKLDVSLEVGRAPSGQARVRFQATR